MMTILRGASGQCALALRSGRLFSHYMCIYIYIHISLFLSLSLYILIVQYQIHGLKQTVFYGILYNNIVYYSIVYRPLVSEPMSPPHRLAAVADLRVRILRNGCDVYSYLSLSIYIYIMCMYIYIYIYIYILSFRSLARCRPVDLIRDRFRAATSKIHAP